VVAGGVWRERKSGRTGQQAGALSESPGGGAPRGCLAPRLAPIRSVAIRSAKRSVSTSPASLSAWRLWVLPYPDRVWREGRNVSWNRRTATSERSSLARAEYCAERLETWGLPVGSSRRDCEGPRVVRRSAGAVCSRTVSLAPVNTWQWPRRVSHICLMCESPNLEARLFLGSQL
jgi:hypothetical protein